MAEPRQVVLDGASWQSRDDVYRAIATAIGAPGYFGRNLDALWDILQTPEDGARKPPYVLQVRGVRSAGIEARQTIADIAAVFAEVRASGQDIDLAILD